MKKKKILTTLMSAVLSLSMLFPLIGCNNGKLSEKDFYFFSVYNTYKVKRDEMPADREILPADRLEITMVQGEYELLQLIVKPSTQSISLQSHLCPFSSIVFPPEETGIPSSTIG